MSSMIDIMGAMIIGSILLLVAMSSMDYGVQQFVNHNADAIVQNELAELSLIIQKDLRKMGYSIPEVQMSQIIQVGTPNHLRFLSNLNIDRDYYANLHGNLHSDGIPDTIDYLVAPLDTISFIDTSIVLYGVTRSAIVSQEATVSGLIGTIANDSVFRYLDQVGNPVAFLPSTRMIEVSMVALNPNIYTSNDVLQAANPTERMIELRKLLRESYWRQTRVVSKNLRR